ncbi:Putative glycosyltransferase EpsH (plasmid) [Burkholderia sp. AD24]|nr:Putative glycosyltransferase EpsH [Burkholderia sp. AD24]
MLAVIIPAHNEAYLIGACIRSVIKAAQHPELAGEEVAIIVVSDSCTDATGDIARSLGAWVIEVDHRNVGVARATGASAALSRHARWLAFSDADTTVAHDWLVQQLRCGTDAVCGVIGVTSWAGHSDAVRENFIATYRDEDGHRHIHGANLGVSASAYLSVGGFPPVTHNEDVALVEALMAAGATVAWSAKPRVRTSARLDARAPRGFGATLREIGQRLASAATPEVGLPETCMTEK